MGGYRNGGLHNERSHSSVQPPRRSLRIPAWIRYDGSDLLFFKCAFSVDIEIEFMGIWCIIIYRIPDHIFRKIEALKPSCPQLDLANSSAHPDTATIHVVPEGLKPDVIAYCKETKKKAYDRLFSHRVSRRGQFHPRDDPFHGNIESGSPDGASPGGFDHDCSDDEGSESPDYDDSDSELETFERATDAAQDTKGQITAYAVAQLATQFRIHIFSILVFPRYARLIRWDRSGAIVTNAFRNFDYLVDFVWRYNNSSLKARGVDETVSTPSLDLSKRSMEMIAVKRPDCLFPFNFATREGATPIYIGYKTTRLTSGRMPPLRDELHEPLSFGTHLQDRSSS